MKAAVNTTTIVVVDACYDEVLYQFSSWKCFLNDGAPLPQVVRNRPFSLFCMTLVVCSGHGICSSGSSFFFSKITFWERS